MTQGNPIKMQDGASDRTNDNMAGLGDLSPKIKQAESVSQAQIEVEAPNESENPSPASSAKE